MSKKLLSKIQDMQIADVSAIYSLTPNVSSFTIEIGDAGSAYHQSVEVGLPSDVASKTETDSKIGDLSTLATENKINAVSAINEVNAKIDNLTPAEAGLKGQVLTLGDNNETIWTTPIGGTEYITIQLIVETGTVSVSGVDLSVQVEGENVPRELVTDSSGKAKLDISHGLEYVVTYGTIEGYLPVSSVTYRASLPVRVITGVYREDVTINNEHVTVSLSYTTGSARAATLNVETNLTTTSYPIVNGVCEFDVPLGTNYTIRFLDVTGYNTPANQSYTATFRARYVKAGYIGAVEGLSWVKASDGSIVNLEDISMLNVSDIAGLRISSSLLARQQSSFVVPLDYLITSNIVNAGTVLITAKTLGSKQWCNQQVMFENIPCYTSAAAATNPDTIGVLNGENNTTLIIQEAAQKGLLVPAMTSTRELTLTINGAVKNGFTGSYAQMKSLSDNVGNIDNVLFTVFGVHCITVNIGGWRTSTQYSQTYDVYVYGGSFYGDYKTFSGRVVPLFAY